MVGGEGLRVLLRTPELVLQHLDPRHGAALLGGSVRP